MEAIANLINPAPVNMSFQKPKQRNFSPYEQNQGTIVGVSGENFAIIASDNRLSAGYSIYTRNQPKIFKLSDETVLGISGCWCDVLTFVKIVENRFKMYQHEHNKKMSTNAVAQLVSTLLYYKRFFPYYIGCVVIGLDQDGTGRCYGYDPIGHKGEELFMASGSAFSLIAPFLDNQVKLFNMENIKKEPITLEKSIAVVKDAFISACERDMYTGDGITMCIITKDGLKEETFPLRKD